jgi:hypothetical protein
MCYHAQKQFDDARAAFEKAIELGAAPAPNMYNIACGYALAGKKQEALAWLAKSLDAGFTDQETIETDTDMDALRAEPRFIELTGLNPPPGLSRDEQWRYDLDFFARRMKQMHWDLYAKISEGEFLNEIERLKADVPKLKDHQVALRLKRIVASVGDGHTSMSVKRPDEPSAPALPVGFYQFTDGLYIRAAAEAHKDLLGARVLKLGPVDAAEAFERAKPYCSVDNSMGYLDVVPRLLGSPLILEAIGAAPDATSGVELSVRRRDGTDATVRLPRIDLEMPRHHASRRAPPGWVELHNELPAPTPLYLKDNESTLWREYLPQRKLLYVHFGAVADPKGSTFAAFFEETFDFVASNDVQTLVIDMRLNGGGNTGLVMPLIHGLIKCEKVNQPGKLFVIIGRRTFSAAQNTTSLIEMHTNATFVGEPTGSRPNFVGESTYFHLPYNKHRVYCSSRYWQFMVSLDKRTWIPPQIAAPLTFDDYANNRDPAMNAILKSIDGK